MKVAENLETKILCSIHFFFSKICAVYEIMWKNTVERGRPQMTVWRMRITCCTLRATNTHPGCVILIAFPLQRWLLHQRASMLLYTSRFSRGANSPTQAQAVSLLRFLDHTQLDTHTDGRTPHNDWSACHKGRYLHNTQQTQKKTYMLSAEFEPATPVIERPHTYALDRL